MEVNIMWLLLDVFNLLLYLPFFKPDEGDITKNIRELNKQSWYVKLKENNEIREKIIYDKDVRQMIGRFHFRKLSQPAYQIKCQGKLTLILSKKLAG